MSWPLTNISADGTLIPFTTDQIAALELSTTEVRDGTHPTLRLDSVGCSVNRAWFCKWDQRDNALAYLLGAVNLVGTEPNWTLSRIMPQTFPDAGYEQYIALAAEDVRGARSAGIDDLKQIPAYTSAKLSMRYEQVFWGLGADGTIAEFNRYVEQLPSTIESAYLTMPGSMMQFRQSSGGLPPNGYPIPYGIGFPQVLTKIAYKWHRIPFSAWYTGSPLYNRVHGDPANQTLNASGRYVGIPYVGTVSRLAFAGYPAGYVMFDGVEEEIVPDPVDGFPCWNLIYRFTIKNCVGVNALTGAVIGGGHNYLYYGGVGAIDTIFAGYYLATKNAAWIANGSIRDGTCLFNERDLNNLFKVGAVADNDI